MKENPHPIPATQAHSEIQIPSKRLAPILSLYQTVISENEREIDENKSRSALAIAAMIDNPNNLRELSNLWQTTEEQIRIIIRDGFYDDEIKNLGYEIFDRKKHAEKENGKKKKPSSTTEAIEDVMSTLPPDLLTSYEQELIQKVNNGRTNEEIALEYGIKPHSVSVALVRIRRKLEPLLVNAGLVKASDFKDTGLVTAASEGNIDAKKFLRMYYMVQGTPEKYIKTKRVINEKLVEEGLIPLSDRDKISANEHRNLLSPWHKKGVIRKNKRAYVSQEYLNKVRNKRKRESHEAPPTPQHKLLADCIPLPADHPERGYMYRTILRSVKEGKIPSTRGKWRWYVLEEDVQPILEELFKRRGLEFPHR